MLVLVRKATLEVIIIHTFGVREVQHLSYRIETSVGSNIGLPYRIKICTLGSRFRAEKLDTD